MMDTILTFAWYLVIATPQGGMTAMPIPFAAHGHCMSAIAEYEATGAATDGWVLRCVPSAWNFEGDDGMISDVPEVPGRPRAE